MRNYVRGTPEERFWPKVNKDGPVPEHMPHLGPCWEWEAARQGDGYGTFALTSSKIVLAHRFGYELQVGPVPEGMQVLHACDNRRCVRGSHLFPGTNAENNADMMAKGRHWTPGPTNPKRGQAHPKATLTEDLVRECRARNAAGESVRSLAALKGVAYRTLFAAVKGETWRHIPLLSGP